MSQPNTGLSAARLALTIKQRLDEEQGTPLIQSDPIAIIGIGCRFPGNVRSLDDYWKLLIDGVDTIREAPSSRWSVEDWYDADPQATGKTNGRFGSFLDNVDAFDPAFFGLAPREAPFMDPQQRLLLEVTWESLWEAGIAPHTLAGSKTGVFIALCNTDYSRLLLTDPNAIGPSSLTGASHSIASGRISYLLDLQGPSVSIDTACSSSLVAIHLACQSLRTGESRLALAGGATLHLTHEHYVALAKLGMLAPDGRCKTFDARADGFVPGEGSGIVVLKRLADALADGDHVHAVIRGTATTQDGRTTVLTAPNGLAQQAVIRAALDNGRVLPEQIGYVETHGTGTALGDPIEVEALSEVLGNTTACALGAVKTNLGHLEAAAGIAGLIKATLSLEREQILPNLHFNELNDHISLDGTQFFIPTEAQSWPRSKQGRFAGVSSFGFGGTNAHIILEEAPRLPLPRRGAEGDATAGTTSTSAAVYVLPISARDPNALNALARDYREMLAENDDAGRLGDVCSAAAIRRSHYEERIAVTGATSDVLRAGLDDLIAGQRRAGTSRGSAVEASDVVFVCSGQGSQWAKMGVGLIAQYEAFRTVIDECDTIIQAQAGWSLREKLEADESTSQLSHTEYAQPALVATEIALARLWESWGVVPSAVIGHSVGEISAAHIAGAIDLTEAMRIVLHRGRLMEQATGTGCMAAVALGPDAARRDIERFGEALSVAAVNSPESIVISGDSAAMAAITSEWKDRGVSCRALPVDYAFHSAQMEPYRNQLIQALGTVRSRATTIPFISTVVGSEISGVELDGTYWGNNIRRPVLLSDAVQRAIHRGARTFLEIGPHPVLSVSIQECLAAAEVIGVVQPSLRRNQNERSTLFATLGALYTSGVTIDWSEVYPKHAPVVPLPMYPYQRQRYWIQRPDKTNTTLRNSSHGVTVASVVHNESSSVVGAVPDDNLRTSKENADSHSLHPMLGKRISSPLLSGVGYELRLSIDAFPFLRDHRIGGATILPMTGFLEMVLEAIVDSTGSSAVELTDVVIQKPLVLDETEGQPGIVQLFLEGAQFRIFSLDRENGTGDDTHAANARWTLHVTGQFAVSTSTSKPAITSTQSTAIPALPTTLVDVGAYYRKTWDRGAQFGPGFQTVTELFAEGDIAAANVGLSSADSANATQYQIHPALLDGCFQPLFATAGMSSDDAAWVPIAIDRFVINEVAKSNLQSIVKQRDNTGDGETVASDIWISDASGRPIANVQGLRCKRMKIELADPTERIRYHVAWRASKRANSNSFARGGKWLIISDATDGSEELRHSLERQGESSTVVRGEKFADITDISTYRGIIHLVDTDIAQEETTTALESSFERGCHTTLRIVQRLARQVGQLPALWIVTRDAYSVVPNDQAPGFMNRGVLGLARTIAIEHPELSCKAVDLSGATNMSLLVDELLHTDSEDCVAVRDDIRYVARLTQATAQAVSNGASNTAPRATANAPSNTALNTASNATSSSASNEPRRLSISTRGTLDNLHFVPLKRRVPDSNEVEISVEAASLNFRDVLNALGMYPGNAGELGAEFAGRVVQIGEGVTRWSIGDRVMGIAWGSFANYVVTSADLITDIPAGLDSVTAATLPNAFLTAYHCLLHVAKLKAGERVLIHAGAGGVGMAAIQIAKHVGAEVFATAGNPEKRAYLSNMGVNHVLDSRTLDFSAQILELTNGSGVDVVLNSLAGEFISASFATVAEHGRFVEIGKTGIWTEAQVAALQKQIDYTIVDLSIEIDSDPKLLGAHLDAIRDLTSSQHIAPLPYKAFAFNNAQSAFRYMAQARQIGRVILDLQPQTGVHSNATYLVTGGLGGIGLRIAQWLADRGATHLVLVGRSQPSTAAHEALKTLRSRGVAIDVHSVDIADKAAVSTLLQQLKESTSPLRGIVHAAGVIDDGVLAQQSWERFQNVLAPKAYGAWYLHDLTHDVPLDFFIMCSSVSSVFGAPGQGAYAAANAFLDALAARRVANGQAGLSVNWGAWADVGMAARVEAQGKRRVLSAIQPMSPDDCVACLDIGLQQSAESQMIVVDANWPEWTGYTPAILKDVIEPNLHIVSTPANSHQAIPTDTLQTLSPSITLNVRPDIVRQLADAAPTSRRGMLIVFIHQEARRVLGLGDTHPIDERQSLLKMGLDSLMAVELRNQLAEALRQPLPATVLFDYPSSSGLADMILSISAAVLRTPEIERPSVNTNDVLLNIAALSDEEAERMLERELGAAD